MAKPAIHTLNKNGALQNVAEGSNRRIGQTYKTKAEAEAAGRQRAQRDRTEHIVHNTDGKIGRRRATAKTRTHPKGDLRDPIAQTAWKANAHSPRPVRYALANLASAIRLGLKPPSTRSRWQGRPPQRSPAVPTGRKALRLCRWRPEQDEHRFTTG
jgi:hypothetical protein